MDIKSFLEISSRDHKHVCPRQVLGVRIALKGMAVLGFDASMRPKQLLVISETDGCFIDGVIAVTKCSAGHRSLRVEDYGKVAATFVNTQSNRAVRIAPALDVRQRANLYAPEETRHYFAQLQAYQVMPDEELMIVQDVVLNSPSTEIMSRPGLRVNCERCGEEVMNGREILSGGKYLCRWCAAGGYYQLEDSNDRPAAAVA